MTRPLVELSPGEPSRRNRVCVVVHDGSGRLLLVERRGGGWTLPGGGVHIGERRVRAAVREAFEEAGVRIVLTGPQVRVTGTRGAGSWAFPARLVSARRSPEGRRTRWIDPRRQPWRDDPQLRCLRTAGLL